MLRLRSRRARGGANPPPVGPERSATRVVEGPGCAFPLALLLAACSSPEPTVIDGSSPAAFAESSAAARQDLPASDRLDFDRALTTLPARRHSASDPEALRRTTFDGMTAAEVVTDYRQRQ